MRRDEDPDAAALDDLMARIPQKYELVLTAPRGPSRSPEQS